LTIKRRREFVIEKLRCDASNYPLMLEKKYPHVLEKIISLWDTQDAEDYLNDLLKPTYSGGRHGREGFHEQAWDEILHLLTLLKKPRPRQSLKDTSEDKSSSFSLLSMLKDVFDKR
jgi:hypothetical protein